METKFLIPGKPGLKVPYPPPRNDYLPEDGAEVVMTKYWRRRLLSKDVAEGKPKPKNVEKK